MTPHIYAKSSTYVIDNKSYSWHMKQAKKIIISMIVIL